MKIKNTNARGIFESKGGLFDVSNPEMEKNIGKNVLFKDPKPAGTIHLREDLVIEGIQKNYKGDTVYRLTYEGDNFGFPADPKLLIIVE